MRALTAFAMILTGPAVGAGQSGSPAPQNPSPMVEETRAHERLPPAELPGRTWFLALPSAGTVEVLVPRGIRAHDTVNVVVHFHGAGWLVGQAVTRLCTPSIAVTVNVGAGSGSYDRAFSEPSAFDSLMASIEHALGEAGSRPGTILLTAFSAGHGAVRAILRDRRHFAQVGGVLLLDGMHTSYVPEGIVLAAGSSLDSTRLVSLADFASAAVRGGKRMLITHSEIFPGTFASTTETADWLLWRLGLRRRAVLRWGPRGMQQLSEVRAGRFEVLGFAGNAAPDHVDHLHALPELLARLLGNPCTGGTGRLER